MAQFVKIGKHRINLDQVTNVVELGSDTVRIHFAAERLNSLELVDQAILMMDGDEAKRLLLMLDYYDATPVDEEYNAGYARRQVALAALEALDNPPSLFCRKCGRTLENGDDPQFCKEHAEKPLCLGCQNLPRSETGYIWMRTDTEPWEYTCPLDGSHWNKYPDIPF